LKKKIWRRNYDFINGRWKSEGGFCKDCKVL